MSSGRVLIVDDDEVIRECIACALSDEGYDVFAARNGAQALDLLDQAEAEGRPPDLILLDMRMPVMDGWQFAKHYQQRSGPKKAPIVVMTAATDAHARAAEVEIPLVIPKPFDIDEVLATVAGCIAHHR